MVLNFVMVVKFPNSSEIRNGSEIFGIVLRFAMVPKWNGCDINDMVPTFSEWFRRFGIN